MQALQPLPKVCSSGGAPDLGALAVRDVADRTGMHVERRIRAGCALRQQRHGGVRYFLRGLSDTCERR